MGTWGKVSQWCNRLLGIFRFRGRFCFGKGSAKQGVMRRAWLRSRSRGGKGPEACFCYASTHKSIWSAGKTRPGDMGTPGRANKRLGAGSLPLRPKKPACSSHLPHSTLYSAYVSCFRAHSALEYRTFVPTRVVLPGRQKLGLVEAQNFVPSIWAPGTEGASGATGYFGSMIQ